MSLACFALLSLAPSALAAPGAHPQQEVLCEEVTIQDIGPLAGTHVVRTPGGVLVSDLPVSLLSLVPTAFVSTPLGAWKVNTSWTVPLDGLGLAVGSLGAQSIELTARQLEPDADLQPVW